MTEPTAPATPTVPVPTERDRLEIALLRDLPDDNYGHRINEWVASTRDEDGSGRRVFLSPELVVRTEQALAGLIRTTKERTRLATNPRAKAQLHSLGLTLSGIRKEAGQIRDALRRQADAERTKDNAREVAKDVLKEVFGAEYLQAVRLLQAGKSRKEAAAVLREAREK